MSILSNIRKLYLIKWMRTFMLMMPIFVLFFTEQWLTQAEVFWLQAVFSVVIVAGEIPSGYFSDVIGRKWSIVIGTVCAFIWFICYCLAWGFWWFLLAEVCLGLGACFVSGSDSALLYDSLAYAGKEDEYTKYEWRLTSVSSFSEWIAAFIGWFVATISLKAPFIIETALIGIAVLIACTLVEPPRKKRDATSSPLKDVMSVVKYAIHDHPEIKWLILYSWCIMATTLVMTFLIQPYFEQVALPLPMFGIIWGVLNLSLWWFSLYADRYEKALWRKRALISLIVIGCVGYLLLWLVSALWAIVFVALFYFVRAMSGPIIKDYINKLITSDMRATVLSVQSLAWRWMFAVLWPLVGVVTDTYSLSTGLLFSAILFAVLWSLWLLFLHRTKAL